MKTTRHPEQRRTVSINAPAYPREPAPTEAIDAYLAAHPVTRTVEHGATSTIVHGRDEAHADELEREALEAYRKRLSPAELRRMALLAKDVPTISPAREGGDRHLNVVEQQDRANARRAAGSRSAAKAAEREAARAEKRRLLDEKRAARIAEQLAQPPEEEPARRRQVHVVGDRTHVPAPEDGWPATIQRVLDERGCSWQTLADWVGASRSTVGWWLSRRSSPTGDRARKLLELASVASAEPAAEESSPC